MSPIGHEDIIESFSFRLKYAFKISFKRSLVLLSLSLRLETAPTSLFGFICLWIDKLEFE